MATTANTDATKSTTLNVSHKEVTSILAGLRILQDLIDTGNLGDHRHLSHFDDGEPLSSKEIDALCEEINLN